TPSKPVFFNFSSRGKCSAVTWPVHSSRFMPVFMVGGSQVGGTRASVRMSGIVRHPVDLGKGRIRSLTKSPAQTSFRRSWLKKGKVTDVEFDWGTDVQQEGEFGNGTD